MRKTDNDCIRCGLPTPEGSSVCRVCNPAGLPEPSRSQFHATAFLTVLLVLVATTALTILLH